MRNVKTNGVWVIKGGLIVPPYPIYSILDVKELEKSSYTKKEIDSLYQTIYEVEVWQAASLEDRDFLCPIVDYDANKCELLMPYIQPLLQEDEALKIGEEESIDAIYRILGEKKVEEDKISFFLKNAKNICDKFCLEEEDIFNNLSNIGYNSIYGIRIIDYGFSIYNDWR